MRLDTHHAHQGIENTLKNSQVGLKGGDTEKIHHACCRMGPQLAGQLSDFAVVNQQQSNKSKERGKN